MMPFSFPWWFPWLPLAAGFVVTAIGILGITWAVAYLEEPIRRPGKRAGPLDPRV